MKVKVELPSIHTRLRLSLALIIMFVVISSPVVILYNPSNALANPAIIADTSSYHSTLPRLEESSPSIMSSSSSLATPTTQAALQIPRTLQSTDLVNSLAWYQVTFITSTAGAIDKIRMVFPAGTNIGASGVLERVGIGEGTLLKSGSSITYDVTTPVNIPANTFIRLEVIGIKNPSTPSSAFKAAITTRDSGGTVIDGPSQTNVYTIRQIGTNDIANSAVTTNKIATDAVTTDKISDNAVTEAKIKEDIVHVVWEDGSGSGPFGIRHSRDGAGFDPSTRTIPGVPPGFLPAVAASDNSVYVVYEIVSGPFRDIQYLKSVNGGATFSFGNNLSPGGPGNAKNPHIAVSGNTVHVVWFDSSPGNTDIFYRRSTDSGATFGPVVNLSTNTAISLDAMIAVSGNTVHVVWFDGTPGNNEIFYTRSTDGGANFEPTVNLSNNAGNSGNPDVAVSGNNVHVVWFDGTPGNEEIFYRKSTDGGANFELEVNLSNNALNSNFPTMAVSDNSVHVVWIDGPSSSPSNREIFYRKSSDGGVNFDSIVNLSQGISTGPASFLPEIAVSSDNVHVVWHTNFLGGAPDIFYRMSTDDGATFGPTTDLSKDPSSQSKIPAIAVT